MFKFVNVAYESELYEEYKNVRRKVFVEEQEIPEDEEFDELDKSCVHLAVLNGASDVMMGVCRLIDHEPFVKFGRLAVLKKFRGMNCGLYLTKYAQNYCKKNYKNRLMVFHAQSHLTNFYSKLGGVVVSEDFLDEVNILHRTMIFPFHENLELYKIDVERFRKATEFMKGSYSDPQVVEKMVNVVELMKKCQYICPTLFMDLIDFDRIGGVISKILLKYMTFVCNNQCGQDGSLRNDGQLPRVPLLAVEDTDGEDQSLEQFLHGFVWDKLNTGKYADVGIWWRQLMFVVCFCKSIRLHACSTSTVTFYMNLKFEKIVFQKFSPALAALDDGLLMGDRGFVPDDVIIKYADLLQRDLDVKPIVGQDETPIDPPKHLEHSIKGPVVEDLDDMEFLDKFAFKQTPVLVKGLVNHWPAVNKWSRAHFNTIMGHRRVPVEIGAKYSDEDWRQEIMSVNEFLNRMAEQEEEPMYLAQHPLLQQVPELKRDIWVPSLCTAAGQDEEDVAINLWIGPKNTVSPLHQDPRSNIFCQISGTKFVRMISVEDSDKMYIPTEGILTNTSQVDAAQPDYDKHPLFKQTKAFDFVIEPGDALFIPKHWWHYVKATSNSISASFWFDCDN